MREAAEGRPIIDHLKAPRRGAAKRSGAGGRTHRGQTTKPNGATHRPGGGQVPGSMPGCSKPDGGGGAGHREATQKAPTTTHARGHRGEKPPNKDRTPKFSHGKHTKSTRKIRVFASFTRHLEAFYRAFARAVHLYPRHPQTVDL